jgi:hypothetical protein
VTPRLQDDLRPETLHFKKAQVMLVYGELLETELAPPPYYLKINFR